MGGVIAWCFGGILIVGFAYAAVLAIVCSAVSLIDGYRKKHPRKPKEDRLQDLSDEQLDKAARRQAEMKTEHIAGMHKDQEVFMRVDCDYCKAVWDSENPRKR
ncbi:hypothetical protein [Brevibacterium moorei]|uniref:hypothetical protein n=1 Tax=Brevibacterium moorei TaxID=2968457 RepID=UPI00211BF5DE|nr:hypothetical protein [Brevibacterium sp. 68QC2CO]MCQ9385090.1 hypothetical protein [Brevibacterium sp. 68QC2CO]